MSLLVVLAALALGYYHPLARTDWLHKAFTPYADWLERNFNDGQARHGLIAYLLAALLPALMVGVGYIALLTINYPTSPLLGYVLAVGALYLALHSGRVNDPAERIAAALRHNSIDTARARLSAWQAGSAENYTAQEVARVGIEATLRHAHYDLFAPLLWYILLGPAGALLYRLSYLLKNAWGDKPDDFHRFALRAFDWLDWLPARFTAACFAVVGDFEDAVYCWRTQATAWPHQALGIILASGAGALGVRLGEPLINKGVLDPRPELGLGDPADADYLQSAIGMVWRVLVLMVGLLLLLTFAHWLGN